MRKLHIGVDSWIIQDGNYPDLEVGRDYDFALEFYLLDVQPTLCTQGPWLQHGEGAEYRFAGQLVFLREEVAVLDVGVLCYRERPTSQYLTKEGRWLTGLLSLGIDPFFYKESLRYLEGVPSLSYTWRLHQILLETTPWEANLVDGRQVFSRRTDVTRSFRSLSKTDAWNDDNGHGSYVLLCQQETRAS